MATKTTADLANTASAFPWERQPGESVQAFARFLAYRDMEPQDRSQTKVASACGISNQLVQRWAKRWAWLKRAVAYDSWRLALGDELGKRGELVHRARLARLGSASLDKATEAVAKLSETKLDVDAIVALGTFGAESSRRALGISDARPAPPAPGPVPVVVQQAFGPGFAPQWLPDPNRPKPGEQNEAQTERNTNSTKVLVPCGEQVIAAGNGHSARVGLDNGASGDSPNGSPAAPPLNTNSLASRPTSSVRLIERVVSKPKREVPVNDRPVTGDKK